MNEFDQFLKRELKIDYFVRYADDFLILHESKQYLESLLPKIRVFLKIQLKLSLHPDKVFIKTFASGVDFMGWVQYPHHRILRTSTKQRMFKRLDTCHTDRVLSSYRGLLGHGNAHKLGQRIQEKFCDIQSKYYP